MKQTIATTTAEYNLLTSPRQMKDEFTQRQRSLLGVVQSALQTCGVSNVSVGLSTCWGAFCKQQVPLRYDDEVHLLVDFSYRHIVMGSKFGITLGGMNVVRYMPYTLMLNKYAGTICCCYSDDTMSATVNLHLVHSNNGLVRQVQSWDMTNKFIQYKGNSLPETVLYPTRIFQVDGMDLSMPNNTEEYLNIVYGDSFRTCDVVSIWRQMSNEFLYIFCRPMLTFI